MDAQCRGKEGDLHDTLTLNSLSRPSPSFSPLPLESQSVTRKVVLLSAISSRLVVAHADRGRHSRTPWPEKLKLLSSDVVIKPIARLYSPTRIAHCFH